MLTAENAANMAELERLCFSCPWSLNLCRAELEHDYARYWGAFIDDALIGYAGLNLVIDEGHITNIAVLPEHRRSGIAKTLVGLMLKSGPRLFTLEVRESNAAAIGLYASFGFKPVGRRRGYYDKPREDALIMTLELSDEYTGV